MNRTIGDIMERDAYTCRYDQDLGESWPCSTNWARAGLW